MKKIFTLSFFSFVFATSFAQYGPQQNNEQNYNRPYAYSSRSYFNNGNNGFFSAKERDFRVFKINQDFKYQIQSIELNRFMTHHQKKVAIKYANYERASKVSMINRRFDSQFHNVYGRR